MWLESQQVLLPTGGDVAAGVFVGEHTCHSERLTVLSFVSVSVDNGFSPRSQPRCDFIQLAPTYADLGISNELVSGDMPNYINFLGSTTILIQADQHASPSYQESLYILYSDLTFVSYLQHHCVNVDEENCFNRF